MKRMLIIAACLLSGCETEDMQAQRTEREKLPAITPIARGRYDELAKYCDHGRAIYMTQGAVSPSLAVVPDAEECAPKK